MAFYGLSRATEFPLRRRDYPLPSISRLKNSWLDKGNAVPLVGASHPSAVGRLARELCWRQRMELGGEQLGIGCRNTKDDERAGVAEHRRAYLGRELVSVLIGDAKVGREFASFRKKRRKGLSAK